MRQQPCSTGGPSRLLATLGLKEQAVRNVMMSKDIGEQGRGCERGLVCKGFVPLATREQAVRNVMM